LWGLGLSVETPSNINALQAFMVVCTTKALATVRETAPLESAPPQALSAN
jgi:hypothetical protein